MTSLTCIPPPLLSCIAECVQGILPAETVNLYGSSDQAPPFTVSSKLYIFPSMNFSCDGTITDIRMRMQFKPGLPAGGSLTQEVFVYLLLFHDGLNSPTRRVSHILLNQNNTQQESPNEIWRNSDPLSLPVTEGTFIGFAVPEMKSPTVFSKNINFLPAAVQQVEAYLYEQLATNFNELEVLEAARTGDVCQFYTVMFVLPLIAVNFSKYTLCSEQSAHTHTHGAEHFFINGRYKNREMESCKKQFLSTC